MGTIVSVGTAAPTFLMSQEDARWLAEEHFAGKLDNAAKYLRVFGNSLVRQRYFCVEPDWFRSEHSLADKNHLYLEWAEKLSLAAIETCLAGASIDRGEIDHFVFVSSSGIATPSLDVAVINKLGLATGIRRLPLFGLGCVGGAAGIALSNSLVSGKAGAKVLLVAVELNSLTFQPDDISKSNLVASSLFGDGAAAVLFAADDCEGPIEIRKSVSLLRRDTGHLMGWDFADTGFRVVFSRLVPDIIREMIPEAVGRVLEGEGIGADEIQSMIFHPGGKRILEVYQDVLGRAKDDFRSSYDVLGRYGNMSSATVLFVLDEQLREARGRAGTYGLLAAFGPGFSAEATLLRWR
jgi:alkylresorcinol/alkylpyrone synthase